MSDLEWLCLGFIVCGVCLIILDIVTHLFSLIWTPISFFINNIILHRNLIYRSGYYPYKSTDTYMIKKGFLGPKDYEETPEHFRWRLRKAMKECEKWSKR